MALSARESVAGLVLGSLANAFVIVLGLVIPFDDPARHRADNALVSLGGIGVMLMLLLPVSGMVSRGGGTRTALVVYGALSLAAVLVADFGPHDQTGWAVRLSAVLITAVGMIRVMRAR